MRRAKAGHLDARITHCNQLRFTQPRLETGSKIGKAMSEHHPVEPLRFRNRILASAAIIALATGGAFAEGALTSTHTVQAAPVATSDLQAEVSALVRPVDRPRQTGGRLSEG